MFEIQVQDRVGGQKRLRNHQPADGAIVERALQPLGRRGLARRRRKCQGKPRQRAHPLGPHRIPLVGHRRRADLLGLERLFDLALVCRAAAGRCRNDARFRRSPPARQAPGRRPSASMSAPRPDRLARKSECRRQPFDRARHLRVVAVEELEEARLSAGRSLRSQEFQPGEPPLDLFQVENQLMAPERRPLADRHQLSRLKVSVAQTGQVLPLPGECPRAGRSQ